MTIQNFRLYVMSCGATPQKYNDIYEFMIFIFKKYHLKNIKRLTCSIFTNKTDQ